MATAARGCGVRSPGGIYVMTKLRRGGRPLSEFMVDPAVPVPAGLDIPDRGQLITERIVNGQGTGVWDVYDKIGKKSYPNVQDFVEEVRRSGASRRVSPNAEIGRLTPGSKLVLIHERAIIENARDLYHVMEREMREYERINDKARCWWYCPCGRHDHRDYPVIASASESQEPMPTCVGCYTQLVTGGILTNDPQQPPRMVEREVGAVTYLGRKAPEKFDPIYGQGIFMILPINAIEVIKDPEEHQDVKAMEKALQSALPVDLVDD